MARISSRGGCRGILLCAFVPALVLLTALAAAGTGAGVPLEVLTRDPLASAGFPAYVGLLSNMGVVLWCAAASTCFLTCVALGHSRLGPFLFYSGALSALLMFDDLFMLHEEVFPNGLSISEHRVLAAYAILAAAYVAAFGRTILTTRWHSLPLTGACFALSVAIDATSRSAAAIFWEDAAKFLGIAGWCAYLCSTCAAAIRSPLLAVRVRDLLGEAQVDEIERLDRRAAELVAPVPAAPDGLRDLCSGEDGKQAVDAGRRGRATQSA